jgi:hypothetical protein
MVGVPSFTMVVFQCSPATRIQTTNKEKKAKQKRGHDQGKNMFAGTHARASIWAEAEDII